MRAEEEQKQAVVAGDARGSEPDIRGEGPGARAAKSGPRAAKPDEQGRLERFERFSYAIAEISKHWHKLTSEEMEAHGLRGSHSVYLAALYRSADGLTAPQLGEECGKDKADVSRMMSIMEKKGLVRKDDSRTGSYGRRFLLTDEGREVAAYVQRRAGLAVDIAGRDLTDEQRETLYEALESIAKNLRQLSKDGLPKA